MIQEKTIEEPIYSRLGDDSELADILDLFVDEMPARVDKIIRQLDDGNWEELRRTVHQLKGAAGSYGFEPISASAKVLEDSLYDNAPEEQIRDAVRELVSLCGRIRAGRPV